MSSRGALRATRREPFSFITIHSFVFHFTKTRISFWILARLRPFPNIKHLYLCHDPLNPRDPLTRHSHLPHQPWKRLTPLYERRNEWFGKGIQGDHLFLLLSIAFCERLLTFFILERKDNEFQILLS